MVHISLLSEDCAGTIFDFLTLPECIFVAPVCKSWYHVIFATQHHFSMDMLGFKKQSFDVKLFSSTLKRYNLLYSLSLLHIKQLTDENIQEVITKQADHLQKAEISDSAIVALKFQNCKALQELALTKNTNLGGVSLAGCPQLYRLDLSNSFMLDSNLEKMLTDINTSAPGAAPTLQWLSVRGCKNITMVKFPTGLSNLTYLDMSHSSLLDDTVKQVIRAVPMLQTLKLELCNNLKSLILADATNMQTLSFKHCRNLRTLQIRGFPKLTFLDVSKSPLPSASIEQVMRNNPQLQIIEMGECYNFTGELSLSANGKSVFEPDYQGISLDLVQLNCSHAPISESFVKAVMTSAYQLKMFNLRNSNADNAVIQSETIRVLDLSALLNDEAILKTASLCPNLRALRLESCNLLNFQLVHDKLQVLLITASKIDDKSLEFTVENCRALEYLDVGGCVPLQAPAIRSTSLEVFVAYATFFSNITLDCPKLKSLNVSNNRRLKLASETFEMCPSLKILKWDILMQQQFDSVRRELVARRITTETASQNPNLAERSQYIEKAMQDEVCL